MLFKIFSIGISCLAKLWTMDLFSWNISLMCPHFLLYNSWSWAFNLLVNSLTAHARCDCSSCWYKICWFVCLMKTACGLWEQKKQCASSFAFQLSFLLIEHLLKWWLNVRILLWIERQLWPFGQLIVTDLAPLCATVVLMPLTSYASARYCRWFELTRL